MKAIQNNKIIFSILVIVCLSFLYFKARNTYTSYESNIEGRIDHDISDIHLRINGEELGENEILDNRVILDNVTWTSTHTREEKISPGSAGNFQFELDPTGSEVAILYEMQFVDKVVDEDKILTFGNIVSDSTLVRTGIDTYSGIITLNQIENEDKVHISVDFLFDASEDIEGFREDNQVYEEFFEIHFRALQYLGEELVPYTE